MTLDVLKSLELPLTREQIVAALVGALLAAAALGTYRKRKREHKINTPVDPEEIRRKRLATLQSSQVWYLVGSKLLRADCLRSHMMKHPVVLCTASVVLESKRRV